MNLLHLEEVSLWTALVGYSLIAALAIIGVVFRREFLRLLPFLLIASVVLHTAAIGLRWIRIGHLPVINPFEMLSANLWGLMLAVVIGYWRLPRQRAFMAVVMPIIIMVMAWMLLKPADASMLPPTYKTVWLYIHIAFIKLFLGSAFIALGLSGIVLLRRTQFGQDKFDRLADNAALDARAFRFMALALIFDSMGITAGAIWAQDAWGRYWSWDPLETWSLITWLSIGLTMHVRASFKTRPEINAILILATFCVAFFTFFGIPFVSTSMHKGQI
jgi:cytochrome c-type biogenesis protein CcsB